MQRAAIGSLLFLVVGLIGGCGGMPAEPKIASAPHGGHIVELPGSSGYVELKPERDAASKGNRKGPAKSRIVAYFYQADGTSVMSPPPTDVKLVIGAGGSGSPVTLTSQTTAPGMFASEPGDYPDELRGTLELQVDGKPLQVTFAFR